MERRNACSPDLLGGAGFADSIADLFGARCSATTGPAAAANDGPTLVTVGSPASSRRLRASSAASWKPNIVPTAAPVTASSVASAIGSPIAGVVRSADERSPKS